jgi:hypothetical protein
LIVRRELAFNFARFTPRIGDASLNVLPDWARETMRRHRRDRRHAGPPGSGEVPSAHRPEYGPRIGPRLADQGVVRLPMP